MKRHRDHEGRVVRAEIRTRAEPRQVHEAWVEPQAIARWFVDSADRPARAGETVTWRFDAMGLEVPVPVVEVTPGAGMVIEGDFPDGRRFVQEIRIRTDGGETVVRVVNSGFREGAEWDEEYQGVRSGWDMALATLKHQLERFPRRDRRHVLVMRPVEATVADVARCYASRAGLASWLVEDAGATEEPLAVGDVVAGALQGDGGRLDGRVLAQTGREVLLAWDAREAVLGLKAFTTPQGVVAALDLSAWASPPVELRPWLDGRLDALVEQARGSETPRPPR